MAEQATTTDSKNKFLQPVISAAQALWLLLDVSTLMIRLLFNTFMYDSALGKQELSGE